MIFCDANEIQLGYLRCILGCFEAVLGLKINLAKSEMFEIGEVPNINNLVWILRCKLVPYLPRTWVCHWVRILSLKGCGVW